MISTHFRRFSSRGQEYPSWRMFPGDSSHASGASKRLTHHCTCFEGKVENVHYRGGFCTAPLQPNRGRTHLQACGKMRVPRTGSLLSTTAVVSARPPFNQTEDVRISKHVIRCACHEREACSSTCATAMIVTRPPLNQTGDARIC